MTKKPPHLEPTEHAARALSLIAEWTWLRPTELGRLMFGEDPHSRKYAEAAVRKLMALRLLIARPLPGSRSGTAYVLSAKGAKQLNDWTGLGYQSGKDWGSTSGDSWTPPVSWEHDLMAKSLLTLLDASGYEVMPESRIRSLYPDAKKHPDGLVVERDAGVGYWLEVENAAKRGKDMKALARALVLAARGKPVTAYDCINDTPVSRAIVAIDRAATDVRGYRLNHWLRIENAIRELPLKEDVKITVAWLERKGVGVEDFTWEVKTVTPAP